jgi:hypothetical protein
VKRPYVSPVARRREKIVADLARTMRRVDADLVDEALARARIGPASAVRVVEVVTNEYVPPLLELHGAGGLVDAVLGLAERLRGALRRPTRSLSIVVYYNEREFDPVTLGREIQETLSDRGSFPSIESVFVTLPADVEPIGIAMTVSKRGA